MTGHTVALNHFSDWTDQEYQSILGLKIPDESAGITDKTSQVIPAEQASTNLEASLPTSIDWRDQGGVVAVKDQGQCGSGWAFAAVAAIESSYWKQTGLLSGFSEQQLIDCTVNFNGCCSGCDGGIYWRAWEWLKTNN